MSCLGCRWKAGQSLATLARSVELPPCLLIRRFLELIPEAHGLVSSHPTLQALCILNLPKWTGRFRCCPAEVASTMHRGNSPCQGQLLCMRCAYHATPQALFAVLQKGTHVLRNPKLLEDLSEAPSATADGSVCHEAPERSIDENQGNFKVLMARLQADIILAAQSDIISSPQADLMRSIIGKASFLHAVITMPFHLRMCRARLSDRKLL